MPRRSCKPCRSPGCPGLTHGKYCEAHKHLENERQQDHDRHRGNAAQRGYGSRWRRLRRMYLNNHPLCEDPFGIHETPVPATDVDHIIPRSDSGPDDESNLQALCKSCHSRKTVRENGWKPRRYEYDFETGITGPQGRGG